MLIPRWSKQQQDIVEQRFRRELEPVVDKFFQLLLQKPLTTEGFLVGADDVLKASLKSPVIHYLAGTSVRNPNAQYSDALSLQEEEPPYRGVLKRHALLWDTVLFGMTGEQVPFALYKEPNWGYSAGKQFHAVNARVVALREKDVDELLEDIPPFLEGLLRTEPAFTYDPSNKEDVLQKVSSFRQSLSGRLPPGEVERRYPSKKLEQVFGSVYSPISFPELRSTLLQILGHEAGHAVLQQSTHAPYSVVEKFIRGSQAGLGHALGNAVAQTSRLLLLSEAYADIVGTAVAMNKRALLQTRYNVGSYFPLRNISRDPTISPDEVYGRYGDVREMRVIDPDIVENIQSPIYQMVMSSALALENRLPPDERLTSLARLPGHFDNPRFIPFLAAQLSHFSSAILRNLQTHVSRSTVDVGVRGDMVKTVLGNFSSRLWTISYIVGKSHPEWIGRRMRISPEGIAIENPETGQFEDVPIRNIRLPHVAIVADEEDILHPAWTARAGKALRRINRVIDWLNEGNEWDPGDRRRQSLPRFLLRWATVFSRVAAPPVEGKEGAKQPSNEVVFNALLSRLQLSWLWREPMVRRSGSFLQLERYEQTQRALSNEQLAE